MLSQSIPGNILLFTVVAQRLATYHAAGQFVVPQNQCIACTALVGLLELALETATTGVEQQAQPRQFVAQTLRQRQCRQFGRLAEGANVDIRGAIEVVRQQVQGFQQQHQTLDAHGEADTRSSLATQLRHQAVVTPTGAYRALGAELVGDPLEHGAVVVIQTAHQLVVDLITNPGGVQTRLDTLEVLTRLLIEVVAQGRRTDQQRLSRLVLAVEDAQRVGGQTTLAVFIELIETLLEVGHQCIAIGRTRLTGAQAVELQGHRIGQAEFLPQAPGEHDQLGIDVRPWQVEGFHADLMELAITSFLRLLVAEHRAGIPQFLHLATTGQTMLKHGAHATGSAFGAQGQGFFVTVEEGIHFLVDHVGTLANTASEQLGVLDDGQTDFLVAVAIEQADQRIFQVAPGRRLLRQDIVHATNGLQGLAHRESLKRSNQLRTITAASAAAFSAALSRMSFSSSSTRFSLVSFEAGLPSI